MVAARRGQRGFTLLEVLIVLGLSFVGLFGMMSVMVAAQRAAMGARGMSEATALGQDKLEQMEHLPLASLAGATESGLGPQGVAAANGQYTRTTTVVAGSAFTTIHVRVSWLDAWQRQHNVNLYTIRAP